MPIFLRLFLSLFCLCSTHFQANASDRHLRVAILADEGAGEKGITNVTEQLRRSGNTEVVAVTGKEIASGVLSQFDVVVFTGGSGSKQGNALGEIGRENVRNFVREGGGYVGICAGAYLACSGFSWGIGVLDAKTVDSRWRRGIGNVQVEMTAAGQEVTGLPSGLHEVRYANGPILTPHSQDNIPDYEPIAFFRTELADNQTPKGIMVNSPAIARGTFGKGRVVVSSPHPENTQGLDKSFAPTAVRWAAGEANALQVDANFPGGNILLEKIEGDVVTLRQDPRDTEGWWFYWNFRVRGAAGRTLTFNFTDGAPIGVRGPGVSLDEGVSWQWLGKQTNTKSFTYTFSTGADSVRFSFGMPYTEANLKTFLAHIGSNSALRQETLCQSRKGRAVEQLHVGRLDGKPALRVLVTARAHCCEMMTSYAVEGIIEAALAKNGDGKWFRKNVELLVIPFVDKDGVEEGDQGKNRRPRDHNRDYDANSVYPETRAIQDFVPKWSEGKLRLTVDLHCPHIRGESNEKIYLVGSGNPVIAKEQQRFGEMLERIQKGTLVYRVTNNLPFGKGWNKSENFKAGMSGAGWAGGLPGVKLATTIELPYANASGREVNAETAREFGHDLARAMRVYLEDK